MANTVLDRRQFVASSSFLLLGAACLDALQAAPQPAPQDFDLRAELTPAETELVNGSVIAKDVDNLSGKGYSCAESSLMVGLRFLKKPEELVWMAGGFGGGLLHADLCGHLTGSIMTIGLYAGAQGLDREAAKEICSQKTREFWAWWTSTAPLHCSEIRPTKACSRLGKLAAVELERLIGSKSQPA